MKKMKWSTIFGMHYFYKELNNAFEFRLIYQIYLNPGMMESGKSAHDIVDYSVSQNTLEQVLLSFVKNQRARQENN